MTDREEEWSRLMRAANAGDAVAYEHLLRDLTKALRSITRRNILRAGMTIIDSEDIVQETLMAIHLKRHTWRSQERIGPWIRAIARHKFIDAFRRRRQNIDGSIDDFAEVLAAPEERPGVDSPEIDRHVDQLPAKQRAVVKAIAVKGIGIGEVAQQLRMTPGAVRVTLHRGLAALAARLRSAP